MDRLGGLRGRSFGRLADLVTGLLMFGFGAVGILYAARPPRLDPVTIWPFALWAGLFILLGLIASPLLRLPRTLLVIGFPLLTALLICEEPRYLLRPLWHDPAPELRQAADAGDLLTVVTVNCGGGDERALKDALALEPDIVLVQEGPGEARIGEIAPAGWSHAGWLNATVMVRGGLEAQRLPKWLAHEMYVVRARPARLRADRPITVISTHVPQPSLRGDIWRPSTWRGAGRAWDVREKHVEELVRQSRSYGADAPIILGGDFNTPNGDRLLRKLEANGLIDTFAAAGRGWPNTITSDYPMARIDYVYASAHFEPLDARVIVTPHSDHRMVLSRLRMR